GGGGGGGWWGAGGGGVGGGRRGGRMCGRRGGRRVAIRRRLLRFDRDLAHDWLTFPFSRRFGSREGRLIRLSRASLNWASASCESRDSASSSTVDSANPASHHRGSGPAKNRSRKFSSVRSFPSVRSTAC